MTLPDMDTPYIYARTGRNWPTLLSMLGVWGVLITLILAVDMALWLAGIVFLFTLPAFIDVVTARPSGITISNDQIDWHAGRQDGTMTKRLIKVIRLDTRLDFSVRCTLELYSGQRIKIPFESCPQHQLLENQLHQFGFETKRRHFTFV